LSEKVAICLPVLNEAIVIEEVVTAWILVCNSLPAGSGVHIEDGGSTDGTVEILKDLQSQYSNLYVDYRQKADGFGAAAKRLLASPNADWIFFTDSDGQYVAEDFWILWNRRMNFDVIRGIKMGRQDPFIRRVTSFFWNKLVSLFFNLPLIDINAAFVLIRKSVLDEVLPKVNRLETLITSELIIRVILANFELKNTYVQHRKRKGGKSRGVPASRLPFIAIKQLIGLTKIKSDYRVA
jgi:dolichol-phosphate mannosyltransferase